MEIKNILFASAIAILTSCGTSSTKETHNHETVTQQHQHHHHDHDGHNHEGHSHEGHNHNHANNNHVGHQHNNSDHHKHNHDGHEHAEHVKNVNQHSGHEHSENSDEIVFSDQKAKHFGVETSIVKRGDFNEVIKVSGQISPAQGDESVISAKSSGILKLNSNAIEGKHLAAGASIGYISSQNVSGGDANEAARINYEAAKRELERITPLYKDKIITEREYNQAKQTFDNAKASLSNNSGAGSNATSNITGTLTKLHVKDGTFVEVGTPIGVVSKNAKLILRADLPNRYAQIISTIRTANFKPSYTESVYELSKLNGKIVSNKNLSVVTPGYIPINFEFSNTNASIIPGSYAEIYLLGSSKKDCITLPLSAITEEEGFYFVYAKIHHEAYIKKEVKLGLNNGEIVEILSGIVEGDEIVTKGAILVKLASQAGSVPGHSHEH